MPDNARRGQPAKRRRKHDPYLTPIYMASLVHDSVAERRSPSLLKDVLEHNASRRGKPADQQQDNVDIAGSTHDAGGVSHAFDSSGADQRAEHVTDIIMLDLTPSTDPSTTSSAHPPPRFTVSHPPFIPISLPSTNHVTDVPREFDAACADQVPGVDLTTYPSTSSAPPSPQLIASYSPIMPTSLPSTSHEVSTKKTARKKDKDSKRTTLRAILERRLIDCETLPQDRDGFVSYFSARRSTSQSSLQSRARPAVPHSALPPTSLSVINGQCSSPVAPVTTIPQIAPDACANREVTPSTTSALVVPSFAAAPTAIKTTPTGTSFFSTGSSVVVAPMFVFGAPCAQPSVPKHTIGTTGGPSTGPAELPFSTQNSLVPRTSESQAQFTFSSASPCSDDASTPVPIPPRFVDCRVGTGLALVVSVCPSPIRRSIGHSSTTLAIGSSKARSQHIRQSACLIAKPFVDSKSTRDRQDCAVFEDSTIGVGLDADKRQGSSRLQQPLEQTSLPESLLETKPSGGIREDRGTMVLASISHSERSSVGDLKSSRRPGRRVFSSTQFLKRKRETPTNLIMNRPSATHDEPSNKRIALEYKPTTICSPEPALASSARPAIYAYCDPYDERSLSDFPTRVSAPVTTPTSPIFLASTVPTGSLDRTPFVSPRQRQSCCIPAIPFHQSRATSPIVGSTIGLSSSPNDTPSATTEYDLEAADMHKTCADLISDEGVRPAQEHGVVLSVVWRAYEKLVRSVIG